MKVIVFGATGLIGQGVLRECLLDDDVTEILVVGRTPIAVSDPKLREIIHHDFTDFSAIESEFVGYDACFYCLGVSSVGIKAVEYEWVTYDLTFAAAQTLARLNSDLTFVYVSAQGADSTEKSKITWARAKGRIENALFALPFQAYSFRPGYVQPINGEKSKTPLYTMFYRVFGPLYPRWGRFIPNATSTVQIGKAMIEVANSGAPMKILHGRDFNTLAQARD
ncbi:MAG: epimerase [Longispora sp.]|nr:epimerase [Longispora sp. (in: high G+C Gram-positive bacteria)]